MNEPFYCSIILPVYNERETIRRNVPEICARLEVLLRSRAFELIIVDNGSTDGSELLAEELSVLPQVVYVRIPERGRGGALKEGFTMARGTYVGVLSIDRAWDEEFLPLAIERLEGGVDIVYGPKTHPQSRVKRPLVRGAGSMAIRLLMLALFGRFFHDTQCIKVFRAAAVPYIGELRTYNYFAETEFFLRALKLGIPSVGIPVTVKDFRRDSKVRLGSFIEFMREARDFRRNVWRGEAHR